MQIKQSIAFGFVGGAMILALVITNASRAPKMATELNFQASDPALKLNVPLVLPQSSINEENLTQEITEQISGAILSQQGEGKPLMKPEELVENYVAERIKNFDYSKLKPRIDANGFKITGDTTAEVKRRYLAELTRLAGKRFGNLSRELATGSMIEKLDLINSAYELAIQELYELTVPKNLASLHQKVLEIIGGQKIALNNVQNYSDDPLKAILSLGAIDRLNEELAVIQQTILKIAQKNS